MADHFVVMFNFKASKVAPTDRIEAILDIQVVDWLRFAPNQYIVYHAGDPSALYAALKSLLQTQDNVLVMKVDLAKRWGWAAQIAVDWLRKYVP